VTGAALRVLRYVAGHVGCGAHWRGVVVLPGDELETRAFDLPGTVLRDRELLNKSQHAIAVKNQ